MEPTELRGPLGRTHTTRLLKPDSDVTRPAGSEITRPAQTRFRYCQAFQGLLRPDSAFKNQEAPGPMKFFSGGVASNVCMPQPLISKP